jgi:hypothetical protein
VDVVDDVVAVEVVHLHAGLGPCDRERLVFGTGLASELLRRASRDAMEGLPIVP